MSTFTLAFAPPGLNVGATTRGRDGLDEEASRGAIAVSFFASAGARVDHEMPWGPGATCA